MSTPLCLDSDPLQLTFQSVQSKIDFICWLCSWFGIVWKHNKIEKTALYPTHFAHSQLKRPKYPYTSNLMLM